MHTAAVLSLRPLYEGFGAIPAIEAQAVGTPVLFSDVGSLSELKGPWRCRSAGRRPRCAWVRAVRRMLQSNDPGNASPIRWPEHGRNGTPGTPIPNALSPFSGPSPTTCATGNPHDDRHVWTRGIRTAAGAIPHCRCSNHSVGAAGHRRAIGFDVGCGVGTWLAACAENGIDDYLGIDGYHVDADLLQIPRRNFRTADLREPLTFDRAYDLALSVEVAEHLPPEAGPALVKQLTSAAPAVLFWLRSPGKQAPATSTSDGRATGSASSRVTTIPGGRGPSGDLDLNDIPFWYRQNVILYLRSDRLPGDYVAPRIVDLVHPELLGKHVAWEAEERHVSGRTALSMLARSIGRRLRMTTRNEAKVK